MVMMRMMQNGTSTRALWRRAGVVVVVLAAVGTVSCSNLQTRPKPSTAPESPTPATPPTTDGPITDSPVPPTEGATPGGAKLVPPPALTVAQATRLQSEAMDMVDDMMVQLAEAVDEINRADLSIEARTVAHRLKYTTAQGAVLIAMSKNPRVAMVDLMVMTTLQARLMERNIIPKYFGPEAQTMQKVFVETAVRSRKVVEREMAPEIVAAIDGLIDRWLVENPDRVYAGNVRFSQFAGARQLTAETKKSGGASNVLGLLFLDPLSGLDPTTREIERTRMFAERAMYYVQRMPTLVSWQAELLFLAMLSEPESEQLLANTQSLTDSIQTLTEETTALRAQLPEVIATEREAALGQVAQILDQQRKEAIDQAFVNLAKERSAAIEELAAQEDRLGPLVGNLHATVEAGTALSESLRQTTTTFSLLATQLGLDQSQKTDQPASGGDGEPFDIGSYTEALREAAGAAGQLTELTQSLLGATDPAVLETRLGLVDERLDRAEGTIDRLLGRALWIGLILVGAATLGGIIVVLLWSRVRRRGQITVSSARVELAGEQYDGQ